MITETNIDILKARVSKGIIYCNDIVQQAKANAETPVKLDKHIPTLNELADMLQYRGFKECVFGSCRNSESFCCLVCSEVKC